MSFAFIDFEDKTIEGKKFICIYILCLDKKQVFKIFKLHSQNLYEFLADLDTFEDVTRNIDFVIKNDGRICLDFKL